MYWNGICDIHGPQNCMKWMKSAFRCWNLCFRMILLCFNPVSTIHLFLWGKIAAFGCCAMARLWIQITGFGFCLWQSLNDSLWHFSNTKRYRMTIENLILASQIHTLFSENKTMSKLHCQGWKCLLRSILKLFEEFFACKLNCLKQSLIWCNFHSTWMTTEEFLYPTHWFLKVCFWGYVHLRHSYGRIRQRNHLKWFLIFGHKE